MDNEKKKEDIFEGLNKPNPLTPKQEMFVQLFVKYQNATQAYREAYNSTAPDATANPSASRLLRHVKISARITEIQAAIARDFKISNNWMFQQYCRLYNDATDGDKPNKMVALKALEGMNKMLGGLKLDAHDVLNLNKLSLDEINDKLKVIQSQQKEAQGEE